MSDSKVVLKRTVNGILENFGSEALPPKLVWEDWKRCYVLYLMIINGGHDLPSVESLGAQIQTKEHRDYILEITLEHRKKLEALRRFNKFVHGIKEKRKFNEFNTLREEATEKINGFEDGYEMYWGIFNIPSTQKEFENVLAKLEKHKAVKQAKIEMEGALQAERELAKARHESVVEEINQLLGGNSMKWALALAKKASKSSKFYTAQSAILHGALRLLRPKLVTEEDRVKALTLGSVICMTAEQLDTIIASERQAEKDKASEQSIMATEAKNRNPVRLTAGIRIK